MLAYLRSLQLVVVRVRNRLRIVEKLEIVQQEHTVRIGLVAFRYLVLRNFRKPETLVIHRYIQVAAGHVRVFVARTVLGDNLGQEPAVEMLRNLALFREGVRTHGNPVRTEPVFDHTRNSLVLAGAPARTEVRADAVCGVTVFSASVAIAIGTVQPVVDGHGNLLERAVAKHAGVTGKQRGNIGLVPLHPDRIGEGGDGIQQYLA